MKIRPSSQHLGIWSSSTSRQERAEYLYFFDLKSRSKRQRSKRRILPVMNQKHAQTITNISLLLLYVCTIFGSYFSDAVQKTYSALRPLPRSTEHSLLYIYFLYSSKVQCSRALHQLYPFFATSYIKAGRRLARQLLMLEGSSIRLRVESENSYPSSFRTCSYVCFRYNRMQRIRQRT